MGWLELLPLLRRVLPLLDRLTPMLESVLAGRAGAKATAESNSNTLDELSKHSSAMETLLDDQRAGFATLRSQVDTLKASMGSVSAEVGQLNRQVTAIAGLVRLTLAAALILGVLCLILLAILLLRHN